MTNERNYIILKIILLLVFIAAIITAVLLAFQGDTAITIQWEKLNPTKILEDLKEDYGGIADSSFRLSSFGIIDSEVYLDNLLILTDSDIRLLNSKGEEIWYYTHEIRHPVLRVKDQMALIYEQAGKSYMIIKDGKILLKSTLEQEIAFGEITEEYALFISTNAKGYKRTLYKISSDNGIQLGALFIDDFYPYFIKTSDYSNGTALIVYGLGMSSNKISTIIRLYKDDIDSSPITSIELEGLYPILFDNGQTRLFAGQYGAYCYNETMDLIWSKNFETEIMAAGLFENGGTVFAVDKKLLFYNGEGKEIKSISVDNKVNSIEVYKNVAAVVSGTEALFYDSSGNVIDEVFLSGMTVEVHFINGKKAFVVSEHEAVMHTIASKKNIIGK